MTRHLRAIGPLCALGAGGAVVFTAWRMAAWMIAQPLADAWAPDLFWSALAVWFAFVFVTVAAVNRSLSRAAAEAAELADDDGGQDHAPGRAGRAETGAAVSASAPPACPDPNCPRCRNTRKAA